LRIEDTDQSRFREDALQDLFEMFSWMGLDVDEGPDGPHAAPNEYFQTERAERYQEVALELLEKGMAYYAYERAEDLEAERIEKKAKKLPTGYERTSRFLSDEERAEAEALCRAEGRKPVIRFAVPLEGSTSVVDAVRGEYAIKNSVLEDMILLKSDGLPTYHLGHIVDDHDFSMTHVMRGVEYIPTAPFHVLIHQALGWTPPTYVHLPLIMDPSGKGKMSKRKQLDDGTVIEYMTMVHEFREAGYLAEALVNYIATLGWSVGPDRDIASLEEMIEKFDIADIKKSSAAFNYEKLLHINGHYMRQLDLEDLAKRVTPFLEDAGLPVERERLLELLPLIQERMKLLAEAPGLLDFFLADAPLPKVEDLPPRKKKKQKMDIPTTIGILEGAKAAIAETDWTLEAIDKTLRAKAKEMGLKAGQLFQPIRVAITGRKHAPGIFETVYHVGREKCLSRITRAINLLQENV
jgi:glutamyl-tRNA synthetase